MASDTVQDLLRFLTQDAKLSLAVAMSKVIQLQKANLTSCGKIAKADWKDVQAVFGDEKAAKQVLNAAKRATKKRGASDEGKTAAGDVLSKRSKLDPSAPPKSPFQIEQELALPMSSHAIEELADTVFLTNRAPLALAFALCVLKYTMPEQPMSSRLSLAQAVVSANSRAKAVSLGLESGKSAEQEGWGQTQPTVRVLGRDIRVLKRCGYDPKEGCSSPSSSGHESLLPESKLRLEQGSHDRMDASDDTPLFWGLDLEALKRSNGRESNGRNFDFTNSESLPIFTPESARSYLLKSFSCVENNNRPKSSSSASQASKRKDCLSQVLRAIDIVCQSWAPFLSRHELDRRGWTWYLNVRPEVQSGVRGWGEKGPVKLSAILALQRDSIEK